jgi:hypothetical protein
VGYPGRFKDNSGIGNADASSEGGAMARAQIAVFASDFVRLVSWQSLQLSLTGK